MAKTEFTKSHALRVEKWSAIMFKYNRYKTFFGKFIGKTVKSERGVAITTDPNAMVQLKADFRKGKGDKVHFGMIAPLTGEGVTGDSQLEGNEERLQAYEFNVELFKVRNAVRSEGTLSDKRVVFDAKMQSKDALGIWMGHKVDKYSLMGLSGIASADGNVAKNAPSPNRRWQGGQIAAGTVEFRSDDSSILSTDLFGPEVIEWVRRKAILTEPTIRPIMIDGKPWYVMFLHPYQVKDMKASTAWKNGHYYADVRGMKNALFTGALGAWDGVVLHEWSKIETRLGDGAGTDPATYFESGDPMGSGIYGARALFCGAQSLVHAYGKLPYLKADNFDYGDEWGVAIGVMMAMAKPDFNSEDYGTITVDTSYNPDA